MSFQVLIIEGQWLTFSRQSRWPFLHLGRQVKTIKILSTLNLHNFLIVHIGIGMQAISNKKADLRIRPYNGRMASGRTTSKQAPFFGQRLSYFRKKRGMTQQELADALEISRSLVHHYERSCPNPTSDFVLKVSKVLDVSLDELFDLKPEKIKSGPPPRMKKLTQRLIELPKAKQGVVLEMLESYLDKAS